jgi:MYXO-CTERM domain-containing protein
LSSGGTPSGGSAGASGAPPDNSGCSCRVANGSSGSPSSSWLALVGLAAVWQRRSRRRARAE